MPEIEYLTDKNGTPKAVVIPIELWQKLRPNEKFNDLSEELENYCLNQAMNEAELTPLLDKEAALKFMNQSIYLS